MPFYRGRDLWFLLSREKGTTADTRERSVGVCSRKERMTMPQCGCKGRQANWQIAGNAWRIARFVGLARCYSYKKEAAGIEGSWFTSVLSVMCWF